MERFLDFETKKKLEGKKEKKRWRPLSSS